MRSRLTSLVLLSLVAAMAPWASSTSAGATVQRGGCVARITRFDFRPATAAEGARVTLRLAVQNCTTRTQHVRLTRFGTEPPGCPVIDPLVKSATIKPSSTYHERTAMSAPPCAGTEQMTERVADDTGKQLSQATATLNVTA